MEGWLGRPFQLRLVGRPATPVPAVGNKASHAAQQQKLLQQAFSGL
ncbi:MAG: hypothetical protein LBH11_07705 [Propionibacteriaceae bacterium]|nr:hypothetical protein [Propionibacteriaceae bacterium]